jgi:hypothetical protein
MMKELSIKRDLNFKKQLVARPNFFLFHPTGFLQHKTELSTG